MWYVLLMLALHPAVQDTLYSEITQILGTRQPSYEDFPSLTYALCIMFETLRLFPSVVGVPKVAAEDTLLLGKYPIPRGTAVIFDIVHVHRDPEIWGPDSNDFNPSRFDSRNVRHRHRHSGSASKSEIDDDTSVSFGNEKIRVPCKGAFLPFSDGQRSCLGIPPTPRPPPLSPPLLSGRADSLGKKFAQVELVASLIMISREWEIGLKEGWSPERVWGVIDMSATIITLAPPEDIPLVFRKRV